MRTCNFRSLRKNYEEQKASGDFKSASSILIAVALI